MRLTFRLPAAVLLLLAAPAMVAHLRNETQPGGLPLVRTDVTNIEYLVNDQTAAGMTNSDGQAIITAGSDPVVALRASLAAWSAIPSSAIRFADLQTTDLTDDGNDRRHVFTFTDTPEHRTRTGGALAITSTFFNPATGELSDTDIIFNPTEKFSTDLTADTFDLESTTTHELGHALGADHTNFFGATMYQSGPPANNLQATLSTDDIGFATAAYPAPGQAGNFGRLTGTVTRSGQGVPGAFVTAIDVNNFTHVSGLTDVAPAGASAFTYTIDGVPPGTYMVYVEPLDGPVFPGNIGLPDILVESDFHTTAAGSFAAPTTVMVAGGGVTTLDLAVEPGPSAIDIDVFGQGAAGGQGDAGFGRGFRMLTPGEAVDLMVWGEGIDASITENDIHLLANGVTLRTGSLRLDPLININGRDPIRFTVDVAANAPNGLGTVVIAKNGDAAAWSGGLIIRGAGGRAASINAVINAASGVENPLTPGEFITIYGENLGPSDFIGGFAKGLGGTRVFVNGIECFVTFASGTQVNAVLTTRISTAGSASVVVEYEGVQSPPRTLDLAPASPGIFTQEFGLGQAWVVNQDSTFNDADNAAPRGTAVAFFATGQGVTDPVLADGEQPSGGVFPAPVLNVSVTIGGRPVPTENILFAGLIFGGVLQVNLRIPDDTPVGPEQMLILTIGGASSRQGVTMAVE